MLISTDVKFFVLLICSLVYPDRINLYTLLALLQLNGIYKVVLNIKTIKKF